MAKPKCPPHDYRLTDERDGWITHTCRKCGDQIRRQQGRSDRHGRLLATLMLVMAACTALTIRGPR